MTSDAIRVLLVDDHTILREGIKSLLSEHDHIQVVGEADNGRDAVEEVQRLSPDVVLMDISMPEIN
ncbi:MAG: response regulator transcription factor, partial [Bacillota bacterium]